MKLCAAAIALTDPPSFSGWFYNGQHTNTGSFFCCLEAAPFQQPSLIILPGGPWSVNYSRSLIKSMCYQVAEALEDWDEVSETGPRIRGCCKEVKLFCRAAGRLST